MTLALYATHPEHSKGRLHAEPECTLRSPYGRDRDRIVHSAAFRRLEYKTQVFINHEGDHYRTRLTHSLEVGQLARALCRSLHLNEDVGEAVALAHDLGHPPFGHAGEDGLKLAMQPYGGFDHNAQAIRILTLLEQRYALFDGLNLTWEVLEGAAKHNGALTHHVPDTLAAYDAIHNLELHSNAGAEAQLAALADDIAYNNHDIEDGVRAGFFHLEELADIPLMDTLLQEVYDTYGVVEVQRQVHEVTRRLMSAMVADVLEQARLAFTTHQPETVEDIRHFGSQMIDFSEEMQATNRALKAFLMQRMYKHYRVNRMTSKARRVVVDLFNLFHAEPECLPTDWQIKASGMDNRSRARLVCDFIAGMTDRFALNEHRKLFDVWEKT